MKTNSKRGSALIISIVFGLIMTFIVGSLLQTSLTEYRYSIRHQLDTVAFSVAENGIERAANAIMTDLSDWVDGPNGVKMKTFSYGRDTTKSNSTNQVTIRTVNNTYVVTSRAESVIHDIVSNRAIQVTFIQSSNPSNGIPMGLVAINNMYGANVGYSGTQSAFTVDSYSSKNNLAPSTSNRSNKAFVGTLKNTQLFDIPNGNYYATLFSPDISKVNVRKNTNPPNNYLVKLDDLGTEKMTLVEYDPKYVRTDIVSEWTFPVPPKAPEVDGWVHVLPVNGEARSQWKTTGKLNQFSPKKEYGVTVVGDTLNVGVTNSDKYYIATTSLNGITKVNVSGTAVIVIAGESAEPLNNGFEVKFMTPDASLTVYSAVDVNNAQNITTSQSMFGATTVPNWESSRLQIIMLPSKSTYSFINMASLNPAAIQSHVENVLKSSTINPGADISFRDSNNTFVGQIIAPYSRTNLELKINFCGSIFTRDVYFSGNSSDTKMSNFHYDEGLSNGTTSEKNLSVVEWREIIP